MPKYKLLQGTYKGEVIYKYCENEHDIFPNLYQLMPEDTPITMKYSKCCGESYVYNK